ncbi:MAG: thioredoxin domain-containing protein [Alphaproteobacteria bacterium]|nr:thioredoxin domain-containing protein [Alphaproteobacteria bacterium]
MRSNNVLTIVILLLIIGVAGAGYYLYTQQTAEPVAEETAEAEAPVQDLTEAAPEATPARTVEDMMGVRSLGDESAPVTVIEYSSLTCSHCADFHKNSLPAIKQQYVDTGKVRFIFKEFPLNAAALDASKLLRCMPEDKYLAFQDVLFTNQENWAYEENYRDLLLQNAQLAGLSAEDAQACLDNEELGKRITKDMQEGGKAWKVSATPTFVINNGVKIISGDHTPETFGAAVDEALAAAGTAPEAAPAADAEAPSTDTLQPAEEPAATEEAPADTPATTEETTTEEPAKTE